MVVEIPPQGEGNIPAISFHRVLPFFDSEHLARCLQWSVTSPQGQRFQLFRGSLTSIVLFLKLGDYKAITGNCGDGVDGYGGSIGKTNPDLVRLVPFPQMPEV